MAVLLSSLKVPLSWREILRRTFVEAMKDNCMALAAQLAYYFFFALFPALLVLLAIASYFPLDTLVDDLFRTLGGFAPPEVLSIITDQILKISDGKQGGLLTVGMLVALWSSSAAMTSLIDTLNAAYDIEEGRPWWKVRIIAILLTIGVALFILVSFALVLVGPALAERVANWFLLGPVFEWTWKLLQWPLVFLFVSSAMALIYYFAPDAEQDWVWLTPGSLLATTLWLGASIGFKYYVANMGSYTETYGAIGGVMVLMLWFYISGLVILIGAEMNAEIEHASPYGKDEGEKIPGQKRKLGTAAMRAWIKRRRQHGEKPPSADEVKAVVGEPPPSLQPGGTAADDVVAPAARTITPAPASGAPIPVVAATKVADRPATAQAMTSRQTSSAGSYLLGAGIVMAQAWFAMQSWRRIRH